MMMMMMRMIIIITNLIYIAQFGINGIFTALYIVIQYIQTQHMLIWTYIQSYSYTYTCQHMYKYIQTY